MSFKVIRAKHLPSGNVFWCVATLGFVVEDFSGRTAEFTWLVSVEADVELLAVVWVGEVGVGDDLAGLVVLVLFFRALESVLQRLLGFDATFAVCALGPDAGSGVFVEVQTSGALVLDVLSVNAGVEDVADGGVGMGEKSVLSWAEIVLTLRCLCFRWNVAVRKYCRDPRRSETYGVLFGHRSQR